MDPYVEAQPSSLPSDSNAMEAELVPSLTTLIQDADQPAIWYHRVKKAWAESVENGTAFVNPVQERTLRWRS